MDIYVRDAEEARRRSLAYRDNVLPDLVAWTAAGERCALVTLIGVDGNAPRAEGAQMAVSESGQWSGYISGGCLEQAIALEAMDAIKAGKPRLLRYGKGSPYFDIRLPCGSGLDVLIQPIEDAALIRSMCLKLEQRQPFALRIDLSSFGCRLECFDWEAAADTRSRQEMGDFLRVYLPSVRCVIAGSSPIAVKLAELAACTGFETVFFAPDVESLPALSSEVVVRQLEPGVGFPKDYWTAGILAFHDHDQELPVFAELLGSPCFFIGAIGSRNAQAARVAALSEQGFAPEVIARIQSPAGLLPGLKSAPLVALSILSQVVSKARERGFVC